MRTTLDAWEILQAVVQLGGGTREVRLNLVWKDLGSVSRGVHVLADLVGFDHDLEEVRSASAAYARRLAGANGIAVFRLFVSRNSI